MIDNFSRLRRYRQDERIRSLFQDTSIRKKDLIIPLFFHENEPTETIASMPFVKRYHPDCLLKAVEDYLKRGFETFILFPALKISQKDLTCQLAFDPDGPVPTILKTLKRHFPEAIFIADVALDPYHIQGQDGLLNDHGDVDNDKTLRALAEQALTLAHAGADILAPSDMMDGRITILRQALNARGLTHIPLASYSLKFCSEFYGPFRDAVNSKDCLGNGDKRTYQMAPDSAFQCSLELQADIQEGADLLIVKPAIAYLDVITRARQLTDRPLWAYHVSSECALLYHGSQGGIIDLQRALYEHLIAIKRAGASKIITYLANEAEPFLLS